MTRRNWLAVAAAAFCLVLALVLAAPFMAPYGTFHGLDGNAGYIDNGWLGHGLAGVTYLLGDLFCHQEEARCFVLNGSQMPVCIRDTGILIGLPVGFAVCYLLEYRLSDRRFAMAGVVLVLVMVLEWVLEPSMGDMPVPRLLSGVCAGLGAALFLGWALYRGGENDDHLGRDT